MFGILKEKLKKAVKSIVEKVEKKEKVAEKAEAVKEKIEKLPEDVEPEKVLEEVKAEEVPEIKKEVEEAVEKVKKVKPRERKGLLKKITEKVVKKFTEKKLTEEDLEPILNDLATDLLEADVSFSVAESLKEELKKSLVGVEVKKGKENELVISALKTSLLKILSVPSVNLEELIKKKKPCLLLFLGFNGSGKTTSLAKIGKWLVNRGYSCVFAAADTFRAGSEEQLEEHARRLGIRVVKHKYGADPAAVIFDAVRHAEASGIDFVLADTAGRSHTNENLMNEMKKIIRVNKPDLKILVVDSLIGNDALMQAKFFGEVGLDAVVFTKTDINEKGGAIISVVNELKKPVLFVCDGQDYKDIEEFSPEKFVDNLL
jgi:fused signal recognition particle receptor